MTVHSFHADGDPTAHENFARWCKQVPQGLFIHVGPRGAMLHRANCPHLENWNQQEWGDLAATHKVCSDDEQELLDHHVQAHGEHPAKCPDCY